MNGPYPRAGKCSYHQLRYHGEVDGDPVTLHDPLTLQDVGKAVHLVRELLIGVGTGAAVVPLPDDGRLVSPPRREVTVEAVVRRVYFTVYKPLYIGLLEVPLDYLVPLFIPVEHLIGHPRPEPLHVINRLPVEALILLHAPDVRPLTDLL